MTGQAVEKPTVEQVADALAKEIDADVIHYCGVIEPTAANKFIEQCLTRRRRKNVLLILVTMGGNANSTYRIARCLQDKYERFFLFASGYCKSAGTLMATGAHELIMSDHGELGPLDVQMSRRDELWEYQSGLTVVDTLTSLQEQALSAFEDIFLRIKAGSGGSITLRTATDIAIAITTGLFGNLYSQVDPLHVGEAGRAMRIAAYYGRRLLSKGENTTEDTLDFMMTGYPSHEFVIDRWEAQDLFRNVREPTEREETLTRLLGARALFPDSTTTQAPFRFLSSELCAAKDGHNNTQIKEGDHGQSEEVERPEARRIAEIAQTDLRDNGNTGGSAFREVDAAAEVENGDRA